MAAVASASARRGRGPKERPGWRRVAARGARRRRGRSPRETRILPVLDYTRIRLAGFFCLGMALWVLGRALGHRRR